MTAVDWFVGDDYSLGRLLVTEGLAAIYLVAFVAARNQFRPLVGSNGMLPIPNFLHAVTFGRSPSIFHFHYSDRFFEAVCWTGAGLSLAALLGLTQVIPLAACMFVWFALWVLYLSIVNVSQIWYSFGWESLLLEAGFLAIFLGNASVGPPILVLLVLRWLLFRLEFGAGLIKMRGDRCWKDLTCLYYHHETQPMPGPFSWYFHQLPKPLHKVEVLGNHFAQLVVPFGLFAPQPVAAVAATIMIVSQLWLVASGNFSWLNWTTIVLGLSVIPDSVYEKVLPFDVPAAGDSAPMPFVVLVIAVTALVVVLSYWPIRNLISHGQRMNASFNKWHFVNTYGAFGSITRVRYEVIVEGTSDTHASVRSEWKEYGFKGKPGDVRRRPRQFAPYHLRLDWLFWFTAISPGYAEPWFRGFVERLLRNDRDTLKLLQYNPFPEEPPKHVRARMYRYEFTTWKERRETGAWWKRQPV
ncbi:lipase maturation factor family protein [Rhodococcus sp. IEGM 1307]|uniref:lipase maturation factor family protein n=1 Tax=Rhodococcus sp. IEGM 1307 TaxID=3047091 RepID=UPI0024B80FB3|nr:lipase maturation factor family protein [Rhodococcus sp. IEGM 1307]MDI9974925.1 lipase maturation factor family protein [Rhodococcus sp. IEGM 1307]